jgi:hypothetical protein
MGCGNLVLDDMEVQVREPCTEVVDCSEICGSMFRNQFSGKKICMYIPKFVINLTDPKMYKEK